MLYRSSYLGFSMTVLLALAPVMHGRPPATTLTVAQIIDKNVEARGGSKAWRAVQTISFAGKLGVGGNQRATLPTPMETAGHRGTQPLTPTRPAEETQLPFVMELMRPMKMRFELEFAGQTAVQVYDGTHGWKLRPYLNRRVVEPYTAEELAKASQRAELDGWLVDYAAKGTKVELDGSEKVEGRDNYKLKLTMKNGQVSHLWIDSETFLETKMQGTPRRLDGVDHPVEIYLRDYRSVNGLQIPYLLETQVLPVAKTTIGTKDTPVPPEKLIIEKATVNPKLEDTHFSKPEIQVASLTK